MVSLHSKFVCCSIYTSLAPDFISLQSQLMMVANCLLAFLLVGLLVTWEWILQVVKPFLEPKTCNKVKFVYSDDHNAMKIMEELFDMDKLESAFGGKDTVGFKFDKYAERMKEDDKKMPAFWTRESHPSRALQPALTNEPPLTPINLQSDSDFSDKERAEDSPSLTHMKLQSDSDVSDKEGAEDPPSNGVNPGGPVDSKVLVVGDESRNGVVGVPLS